MEGRPDPGPATEERPLAIRAAPPSRTGGDPIAWRGRNAPPSTRAHRLRRPRRAPEGRRPVRQGRGPQPDPDVQGARNGGRRPDGVCAGSHDPCRPDRRECRGRVGGVCRDLWSARNHPHGERRSRASSPRRPYIRSGGPPGRREHHGRRADRERALEHDGAVQRRDVARTVPRRGEEDDALGNLGGAGWHAGLDSLPDGRRDRNRRDVEGPSRTPRTRLVRRHVAALRGRPSRGMRAAGEGLEGGATLAGLRRFYDEGTITPEDRVVLVNTGASDGNAVPPMELPEVRTAEQVRAYLGLTSRAS